MSATIAQRRLLDLLDSIAALVEIDQGLQTVITRIAHRAATAEEAQAVALLIKSRKNVRQARTILAGLHPDHLKEIPA